MVGIIESYGTFLKGLDRLSVPSQSLFWHQCPQINIRIQFLINGVKACQYPPVPTYCFDMVLRFDIRAPIFWFDGLGLNTKPRCSFIICFIICFPPQFLPMQQNIRWAPLSVYAIITRDKRCVEYKCLLLLSP